MYALVGYKPAHYPEEIDESEVVAIFTSKNKAEDYLEKSKLKSYNNWCGRGQHGKQFRSKSLLWNFL